MSGARTVGVRCRVLGRRSPIVVFFGGFALFGTFSTAEVVKIAADQHAAATKTILEQDLGEKGNSLALHMKNHDEDILVESSVPSNKSIKTGLVQDHGASKMDFEKTLKQVQEGAYHLVANKFAPNSTEYDRLYATWLIPRFYKLMTQVAGVESTKDTREEHHFDHDHSALNKKAKYQHDFVHADAGVKQDHSTAMKKNATSSSAAASMSSKVRTRAHLDAHSRRTRRTNTKLGDEEKKENIKKNTFLLQHKEQEQAYLRSPTATTNARVVNRGDHATARYQHLRSSLVVGIKSAATWAESRRVHRETWMQLGNCVSSRSVAAGKVTPRFLISNRELEVGGSITSADVSTSFFLEREEMKSNMMEKSSSTTSSTAATRTSSTSATPGAASSSSTALKQEEKDHDIKSRKKQKETLVQLTPALRKEQEQYGDLVFLDSSPIGSQLQLMSDDKLKSLAWIRRAGEDPAFENATFVAKMDMDTFISPCDILEDMEKNALVDDVEKTTLKSRSTTSTSVHDHHRRSSTSPSRSTRTSTSSSSSLFVREKMLSATASSSRAKSHGARAQGAGDSTPALASNTRRNRLHGRAHKKASDLLKHRKGSPNVLTSMILSSNGGEVHEATSASDSNVRWSSSDLSASFHPHLYYGQMNGNRTLFNPYAYPDIAECTPKIEGTTDHNPFMQGGFYAISSDLARWFAHSARYPAHMKSEDQTMGCMMFNAVKQKVVPASAVHPAVWEQDGCDQHWCAAWDPRKRRFLFKHLWYEFVANEGLPRAYHIDVSDILDWSDNDDGIRS
ncbi:unnamed protein product [Amoebophrya sp. A25]|nr:unnamed protein product [Amoebophrya sp. A25]|eukprot:GSA25T00004461001.1